MAARVPILDTAPGPAPRLSARHGVASAAPASGWRRLAADWIVVGGATGVCHVLGACTSLLLRVLLDPAQMASGRP